MVFYHNLINDYKLYDAEINHIDGKIEYHNKKKNNDSRDALAAR
jgi:hypothetical protein